MPAPSKARVAAGSESRYLHSLLVLTAQGGSADTGQLAARVGVSAAAASRMLRTLEARGLARVEPYRGAVLTTRGRERAVKIVQRHRLLEVFLHQVLHFDIREVHARALRMEPTVDEAFEEKLDLLLDHPTVDPHGQPIPSREAAWPVTSDAPLLDLPLGTQGQVSRVASEDAEAIAYLHSLGISRGASVVLEEVAPFDGPVALLTPGGRRHIGRRLAQMICVGPAAPERRERRRTPAREAAAEPARDRRRPRPDRR